MIIYSLIVWIALASLFLGLSLIGIGTYLWLAAKKMIAGIILLALGVLLASVPVVFVAYLMIATSARG